jgi:hypothetical protein
MNAEVWALLGTTIVTLVFLVPGVVYAYYVLDHWIDDRDSYRGVIAGVEGVRQRADHHE